MIYAQHTYPLGAGPTAEDTTVSRPPTHTRLLRLTHPANALCYKGCVRARAAVSNEKNPCGRKG